MRVRVFKFGGSSFLGSDDYRRIAGYLKQRLTEDSTKIVIVVSAMAGLTERLRGLAVDVGGPASAEASDTLLPIADSLGAALMRVACEGVGVRVTSLMGAQIGFLSDSNFMRARVRRVDPKPITAALERADVVVVPGGQAVDEQGCGTMLGKNSSDLTAVLLASALGLPDCEIYSDVSGVYSADPNQLLTAQLIPSIDFESLVDMSRSGAKVMHWGALMAGQRANVGILCRLNRGSYELGMFIGGGPRARAVVVDARSAVLAFGSPADRTTAHGHLMATEVPTVVVEAAPDNLVVTCGFFDAVRFLAERGIAARLEALTLVSVFDGSSVTERTLVPTTEALAFGRARHDALFRDRPPKGSPPPVVVASSSPSLADSLLPRDAGPRA